MAAHGGEPVPEGVWERVAAWLDRRRTGEPWAYILGWSPWRGRRFETTPAALIPRPETELVLEAALELGRSLGVRRAVDVGTGTGILAVSLSLETDWEIAATDLSADALVLARRNAGVMGAPLAFFQGDLLEPVPDPLELVVSNPPYVDPADGPTLQRELAFEPQMALFAPDHGLALATALLEQARRRRARAVVLEIGAGQGMELQARSKAIGWPETQILQDLAGLDRVLVAQG